MLQPLKVRIVYQIAEGSFWQLLVLISIIALAYECTIFTCDRSATTQIFSENPVFRTPVPTLSERNSSGN